jgi:sugar phosphate isomerase/epimerase
MRISFMTFTCPNWDLKKIIRGAKDYGYDGVEIRTAEGHRHGIELETSTTQRRFAKNLFKENDLEISCLSTSLTFSSAKGEERRRNVGTLRKYIELASDIDATRIRVFGGAMPPEVKREACLTYVGESLLEAADTAKDFGVSVLLETHNDFSLGVDVGKVLRRVNHPNVGAVWDVMHPFFHGESIEITYSTLKDHVKHTHIHDAVKAEKYGKLVQIGEGILPIREIVQILKKDGYAGYLSFEYWTDQGEPELTLPKYASVLRRYISEV